MKNDKFRRLFWKITAILAFFAAAFCVFFLWKNIKQRQDAAARYEQLREEDIQEERENEDGNGAPEEEGTGSAVPEKVETEPSAGEKTKLDIPVDFEKLENENADIYAWLQVPGTDIDYPVVQSRTDDTFYITHGIDRTENIAGAIYSERLNKIDFSDAHTVLYGHNMRDGSMFAGLHAFEDNTFFQEHREIKVYTADAVRTYKIFASYRYDDRHLLKSYDCSNADIYREYLEEIKKQRSLEANMDTEMEVTTEDRILTLSTCHRAGNDSRYLVQAVLTEELLEDRVEE